MALSRSQLLSDANAQAQFPAIPPGLLAAVENQESGGDLNAYNSGVNGSSHAAGPFQFQPGTAADFGLTTGQGGSVYDQDASAAAAATYLNSLITKPGGSVSSAISQYSGNSYTLDQLSAAQQQYLGANATIATSPGQPVPSGGNEGIGNTGGASTGTASAGTSSASGAAGVLAGIVNWVSEAFIRAGVIGLGLGLVVIALFWMFAGAAIHEFEAA